MILLGGGAWSLLVGGVICLVNSDNERDLNLIKVIFNLKLKRKKFLMNFFFYHNFLKTIMVLHEGSLRQ